jgi:hypothetical protein
MRQVAPSAECHICSHVDIFRRYRLFALCTLGSDHEFAIILSDYQLPTLNKALEQRLYPFGLLLVSTTYRRYGPFAFHLDFFAAFEYTEN